VSQPRRPQFITPCSIPGEGVTGWSSGLVLLAVTGGINLLERGLILSGFITSWWTNCNDYHVQQLILPEAIAVTDSYVKAMFRPTWTNRASNLEYWCVREWLVTRPVVVFILLSKACNLVGYFLWQSVLHLICLLDPALSLGNLPLFTGLAASLSWALDTWSTCVMLFVCSKFILFPNDLKFCLEELCYICYKVAWLPRGIWLQPVPVTKWSLITTC
jgi:hypothetical protein